MSSIHITHISRYPIKGLSGESLESVAVAAGAGLPLDRRYGLAHASSQVDAENPQWQSKKHFLNLARDEKLGELSAVYTAEKVTLLRKGKKVVSGNLETPEGRMVIEGMLQSFMPAGARGHARIVDAGAGHFTDQEQPFLSLINLATVQDIERVARIPLDPRRFRGNIYFDGAQAWDEHSWVGKKLRIGGLVVKIIMPIERCNAVNIDPETGKISGNIPLSLRRGFRHCNCGVFAEVIEGGRVGLQENIEVLADE